MNHVAAPLKLRLPFDDGGLADYTVRNLPLEVDIGAAGKPVFNRVAFAAAHVVVDPLANIDPAIDVAIDWEQTLAFREYLWDLGFAVAEAMDTAQRGMGLQWEHARELIRHSVDAARRRPGALLACGAGTDHLAPAADLTLDHVVHAYEEQIEFIEQLGGRVILMASRALAAIAKGPQDYAYVYSKILSQVRDPVILHWLGEMFDPALEGYWGAADHEGAMDVCLSIIDAHTPKVDGIKISLLSSEKEIAMRRRLPASVRMYTGDDFNYAELIAGDEHGYSHALLGIFDAIAPAAAASLVELAKGNTDAFHRILAPTVPLSRHIFKAPTRFYKTGVVFLAWLNGLQDHFQMVGGQQSARSLLHFAELFRLADAARVLRDPELATSRMRSLLTLGGIHQ